MSDRKKSGHADSDGHSRAREDWSGVSRGAEQEFSALDRVLEGISFPASKESLAAHLAVEAFYQGGERAAEWHDLVVQLEAQRFASLEGLHQAIRDRRAWEQSHLAY